MQVYIPSPLHSYTGDRSLVEGDGATVAAVLMDLDRQFPGIRFRIISEQDTIRQHIKLYVNHEEIGDLTMSLAATDKLHIIAALSGG
jgi:molybdopterin converting factor small subunit